jgi:hypothetical protein
MRIDSAFSGSLTALMFPVREKVKLPTRRES